MPLRQKLARAAEAAIWIAGDVAPLGLLVAAALIAWLLLC